MNTAQLLAQFDRISDAPDAVPRLRQFILDLAVRGKLVEQDCNGESAAALLNRIHGNSNNHRSPVSIERNDSTEQLPNLPSRWKWTVIDQIAALDENSITDGPFGANLKTEHYISAPGYRVIRLQNIGHGRFRDEHRSYITEKHFRRLTKHHVHPGDLVVAGLVDPSVRCCEVPANIGPALVKADCYRFAVHPQVSSRFALQFLNSPLAQDFAAAHHHGMTLTRIGLGNFRQIPFPLPPFSEQRRIVAKVDELMALCDRLEAAQAEREKRRESLTRASLHRLNNGAEHDAFRAHARFHLTHLPRLTTRPEHIRDLRQTILNLAVRGKLVPQVLHDESATDELLRIRQEKARVNPNARPRSRDVLASTEVDKPFDVPKNWCWARFGDVIVESKSGWSPKAEGFARSGMNWGVLKVSAVSWNEFRADENKQLFPGTLPPESAKVHAGDFLISRANTTELIAKAVVVEAAPVNLIFSDKIVRLQLAPGCLDRYLLIVNNFAKYARAFYASNASGTSLSMKNVSRDIIYALPVPLPPLTEQHRIVAKVDELMALCDRLETQLTTGQTESRRLLEAILHDSLHSGVPKAVAASAVDNKQTVSLVAPADKGARSDLLAALVARIVGEIHGSPNLGKTHLAKDFYVAVTHCGLPLEIQFERMQAGPLWSGFHPIRNLARKRNWIDWSDQKVAGDLEKHERGAKIAQASKISTTFLQDRASEYDRVTNLFASLTTTEAEIAATAYAVWNDFLIAGHHPTEDEIIHDFRNNWHPKKRKFSPSEIRRWLHWLEGSDLVPRGQGRRTITTK